MKEDWIELPYKEIVNKISTSKQKLKQKEYLNEGSIPVIDQGQELIGGYTNDIKRLLECNLPAIIFGDHTKIVKLIDFPFAPGADGTKVLQCKAIVLPKFLYYLTPLLVFKIKDKGYARHYQHIEKEYFPIPPIPEQRAIVAKIEQLFSELDNGIANLKTAQDQLKVYRQSVFKKAFEGEFTKDWREKQINLPSAGVLSKKIEEERQNFYIQQIGQWKIAVKNWEKGDKKNKKPSKISKPKEFSKVALTDIEGYNSIPSTWIWSRFGSVTYKIGDIDHKMPKTVLDGMPYLSTGNIGKDGKIDFENAKMISKEDFQRLALKIKPQKGDIIFPRYGTIGRNILIDFEKEFLVSYSCAIIKNIINLMDEKFVLYYSLSPVLKKEIKKYTVETTQANIGIASIEMFVFPLCSKEEQHQIVQQIESRLSVCDKVEETITKNLQKAEALRQSILKKAFAGELLSEAEIAACKKEKDWEPAGELLKRIKKNK
jgi:type I restriction enzyme S subunit